MASENNLHRSEFKVYITETNIKKEKASPISNFKKYSVAPVDYKPFYNNVYPRSVFNDANVDTDSGNIKKPLKLLDDNIKEVDNLKSSTRVRFVEAGVENKYDFNSRAAKVKLETKSTTNKSTAGGNDYVLRNSVTKKIFKVGFNNKVH